MTLQPQRSRKPDTLDFLIYLEPAGRRQHLLPVLHAGIISVGEPPVSIGGKNVVGILACWHKKARQEFLPGGHAVNHLKRK